MCVKLPGLKNNGDSLKCHHKLINLAISKSTLH